MKGNVGELRMCDDNNVRVKKCEIVINENVKVWMDENEHDSSRMLDCEARM